LATVPVTPSATDASATPPYLTEYGSVTGTSDVW